MKRKFESTALPVCEQLGSAPLNPRLHDASRTGRQSTANDLAGIDRYERLEALIEDVNMWRRMIAPIHLHDDSKKIEIVGIDVA